MTQVRDVLRGAKSDCAYYYGLAGKVPPRHYWPLAVLLNPSLQACLLFRLSAVSSHLLHLLLVRRLLLARFGCDVAPGVKFGVALYIPHPIGIVIGRDVKVGDRVHIFQNVTLGRGQSDEYPVIGDDVRLFTGCVVAGPIEVAHGSRIRPYEVVAGSRQTSRDPRN